MKARFALAAFLLLAGCAVGPKYHAPSVPVPASYSEDHPPSSPVEPISAVMPGEEAVARWWLVFQDPELSALIARAMRDNRDLKQALSRVRQARAQRLAATAGLWPEVDADGGYYRGRGSKNVVLPLSSLGAAVPGEPPRQAAAVRPQPEEPPIPPSPRLAEAILRVPAPPLRPPIPWARAACPA